MRIFSTPEPDDKDNEVVKKESIFINTTPSGEIVQPVEKKSLAKFSQILLSSILTSITVGAVGIYMIVGGATIIKTESTTEIKEGKEVITKHQTQGDSFVQLSGLIIVTFALFVEYYKKSPEVVLKYMDILEKMLMQKSDKNKS